MSQCAIRDSRPTVRPHSTKQPMYLVIYLITLMILPYAGPMDTAPLEQLEAYCVSQGAVPLFGQNVCQDPNDSAHLFPMPEPHGL